MIINKIGKLPHKRNVKNTQLKFENVAKKEGRFRHTSSIKFGPIKDRDSQIRSFSRSGSVVMYRNNSLKINNHFDRIKQEMGKEQFNDSQLDAIARKELKKQANALKRAEDSRIDFEKLTSSLSQRLRNDKSNLLMSKTNFYSMKIDNERKRAFHPISCTNDWLDSN